MTQRAHPASGQLALLTVCGDLVVAIAASAVHQVRAAEDTPADAPTHGVTVLDIDGAQVAGWNLCALLGLPAARDAWVIVDLPDGTRVGLLVDRCVTVQNLPACRPIPPGVLGQRAGALAAGFAADALAELAGYPAGAVLDLAHVLSAPERAASRRATGAP